MSVYAIGDLHLGFGKDKPMSVFGDNWENHEKKIEEDWKKKVTEKDLVIIPGDFSWSTYLKDTYEDFKFLSSLPGKKILLKGNHDYWWTTLKSMRKYLEENNFNNIDFLYNNSYVFENYSIAGTRGWNQIEDNENKRLLKRELLRLEISLTQALKINQSTENNNEIIVFMHFPPITNIQEKDKNQFIKLMKKYKVTKCFYAHLHGNSINEAVEGNIEGIEIKLLSADALNFELFKIGI